jgi:hypothetical protein
MPRFLLIILIFTSVATIATAQEVEVEVDSAKNAVRSLTDSVVIRKGGRIITPEYYAKRYQPRKALLYSAVVPGMGQIYNRKYWKLPIVYGGFIIITSYAVAYNNLYVKYKNELFALLEHPNSTGTTASGFTESQCRTLIDNYRRERDFFLILDGFMYLLQLVDAHVDAHLREFDLNPGLKVSLSPSMQQNTMLGSTAGISITFKF